MRTHTVRAAELDGFVEAEGAARHREEVRQYVRSMFDACCMRPASSMGAREIGHVLDAPPMRPQWQGSSEGRAELLESVGFVLRRETSRFEWRSEGGPPSVARRLGFRTLNEVGEEAFVGAIERVSEGTLDREV